jgi:hypothetical protein
MGDVVKKVADKGPDCFFWLDIFLSAGMTVSSMQSSAAVEANFLVTFFTV